jgi:hypothetical protein
MGLLRGGRRNRLCCHCHRYSKVTLGVLDRGVTSMMFKSLDRNDFVMVRAFWFSKLRNLAVTKCFARKNVQAPKDVNR